MSRLGRGGGAVLAGPQLPSVARRPWLDYEFVSAFYRPILPAEVLYERGARGTL